MNLFLSLITFYKASIALIVNKFHHVDASLDKSRAISVYLYTIVLYGIGDEHVDMKNVHTRMWASWNL